MQTLRRWGRNVECKLSLRQGQRSANSQGPADYVRQGFRWAARRLQYGNVKRVGELLLREGGGGHEQWKLHKFGRCVHFSEENFVMNC